MKVVLESVQIEGLRVAWSLVFLLQDFLFELRDLGEEVIEEFSELTNVDVAC